MHHDPIIGDIKRLKEKAVASQAEVEARDLELINQAANELTAEVEDILRCQDLSSNFTRYK